MSNVCHFVDLAYQLCGRPLPQRVTTVHGTKGRPDENAIVAATFADGSLATIVFSMAASPHEYVSVERGGIACNCGTTHAWRRPLTAAWSANGVMPRTLATPPDPGFHPRLSRITIAVLLA